MTRVTLITGAGRGIGKTLAHAFAETGDDLVLTGRHLATLEETAAECSSRGSDTLTVPADVSDPAAVEALAAAALGRFGGVDVVINNAGIGGPSAPLWEVGLDEWRRTHETNVTGVFLVSRALLSQMIERGSGVILNIGSISGKRPLWGRSAYTSSKTALIGLTKTLAAETGPYGIRVNLVSPGFVHGPRMDWVMDAQAQGRGITVPEVRSELEATSAFDEFTQPGDVAGTCVFLASDAGAGISGTDISVNHVW